MPEYNTKTHKQVSFILPKELVTWLDENAADIGITRKQLLIRILTDLSEMDAKIDEPGSPWRRVAESIAEAMKPTILDLMEKRAS